MNATKTMINAAFSGMFLNEVKGIVKQIGKVQGYKYVAMSWNGDWCGYLEKPEYIENCWCGDAKFILTVPKKHLNAIPELGFFIKKSLVRL